MEFLDLGSTQTWISLLTLTFLEIVLGIDNIIFISIVCNRLPGHLQRRTRNLGLLLAMGFRIMLLLGLNIILGFTKPLFYIPEISFLSLVDQAHPVSGRDLILLAGGMFLMAKSTSEIFNKMEGRDSDQRRVNKPVKVSTVIIQIILLDLVFSFDSILTAIGLTRQVGVMIVAVIISIIVMMLFAGQISRVINRNPSLQVLALSFLILIGFMLCLEAVHQEIPKGYIYFAVIYALLVELVNLRRQKKQRKEASEVNIE
jgi:predicted tellurium resistance membrane protein TerC